MHRKWMWLGAIGLVATAACARAVSDDPSSSAANIVDREEPSPTTRTPRGGTNAARGDGGTVKPTPTDGGTGTDASVPAPSCYADLGTCDPTNPNACAPLEACDINGSTDMFQCFEPPNDAQLGDACNNATGPFCSHGLACHQNKCVTYCCDDSACSGGTHCTETGAVGAITIKVCL